MPKFIKTNDPIPKMSREKNGETDLILLDPSNYRWSSKTKEKLKIIAISNYFIKSFKKFYKV